MNETREMDKALRNAERNFALDASEDNLKRLVLAHLRAGSLEINIVGKRWFNRNKGSTYHSASVFINGLPVGYVPFVYGYSTQYLDTGWRVLFERFGDILPAKEHTAPFWTWAKDNNIRLDYSAEDVKRKKDL